MVAGSTAAQVRAEILGSKSVRHTIAAAVCTLLCCGWAHGQPPKSAVAAPATGAAEAPAETAPGDSTPLIREEEPSVYLLPDGNDNYKPVINFRFEQFKRLLELERQLETGAAKPSYAVEMSGEGVADGSRVRLSLEFQVTVPDEGWVRVPIRLDEAILLSQTHSGPGEHVVVPSEDDRGYTAWFRGRGSEPHRLSISASVPIERVAGESRFRLSLPRLTTSELKFRVPIRDAVVRTLQGVELERLTPASGDATLVRVLGAGAPSNSLGANRPPQSTLSRPSSAPRRAASSTGWPGGDDLRSTCRDDD